MLIRALILAAIAGTGIVQAQEARGTILGRVTDATGALVVNAEVRATNTSTRVSASAKTNESGNYRLPYLLPGTYTLTGELPGFKKMVRDNIEIRVSDTVEVNLELEVGNVAESVEVKAETPLLSTAESSLGQVIDQRRVQELPSFGGSPMSLVQLAPGVMNSTDMRLAKAGSFSINKNSQFATDGAGTYNNEFTLDGVSNTQAQGTSARVGFIPPQTAVGEFKVQTAAYDASVGHTIGSLVNVSTKAGGNELHGEGYWWLRNSAFDAPNIFQNRAGQKLPVYQDNRYGFWLSGPIYLPKLYDGRNKSFWFYNWEGNQFGVPQSLVNTVPSAAMRNGDLSALLRLGATYQVYDPASTTAAAGGRFQRQPFAGNLIPRSRLDPVGQNLLKFYPEPNQAGTSDGRNNHFRTIKALERTWVHLMRFDHAFSEKHRVFARLSKDFWEEDKMLERTTRFALRLTADVPEDERIRVERVGPEILRNPRHVDGAYFIEEGGRRHIEHIEAQALYRGDEPERLAWYGVDLYHEFRLPVRSTLVLLFENRSPAKIRPGWRGDGGDVRVSSRFRVKRLWEQDAAEVLRQDHPEPLEWTPVLLHDDRACLEAYRRLHARDDRDSLLNFMLLGGFRYGIDRWREVLKGYGEQVMYDNVLDMLEGDDFGREIIARIERRGEERGREEARRDGLEEGLERGMEKGLERGREELRSMIRSSCADYFPGLNTAAIDSVTDLHRLRVIAAAVLRARSVDEARAALSIG